MLEIHRCYDSHLHLQATGALQASLNLFSLTSLEQLADLEIKSDFLRDEWLIGFGWDQHRFSNQQYPTAQDLDKYFSDRPVAFTRADGHATWLNTGALKKTGYWNTTADQRPDPFGGKILRDAYGYPTGIFIDLAKIEVDQHIPTHSAEEKKLHLKTAASFLNQRGFTHIRDMSGSLEQWQILRELQDRKDVRLYVEQNFTCENLEDFNRTLSEAQMADKDKNNYLRVAGIKVYLDGALGSEGAFLSQGYQQNSDINGLLLWPEKELKEVIQRTWQAKFPLAIHAIGDAAADIIINICEELQSSGISGKLNLEHGQLLRPETISKMKKLNTHVHMQPCHFLSDRQWLKTKLAGMYQYVFPWAQLQNNSIPITWGSDSPIELPSLKNNYTALLQSPDEGIQAYSGPWHLPHQHPDIQWGEACKTVVNSEVEIQKVYFDKEILFESTNN